MSVNYRVSKCKNPGKTAIEGTTYYSNKAVKTGEYTFDDLAEDINNSTTCTKADAMAVLGAMKPFITKALLAGQVVVLQDIGRFRISLSSKCFSEDTMQASDFSASAMIRGHKLVFTPEVGLKKDIAANITLHRLTEE